jgi:hypothetical protein
MKGVTTCVAVAAVFIAVVSLGTGSASAAEAILTDQDGEPVAWSDWLQGHVPVAVVLWASWVPEATDLQRDLPELVAAARERNLHLVLISVQEPMQDTRRAMDKTEVEWLHDRFGALLKEYRVVTIPAMMVLSGDGSVVTKLQPTAEALRGWLAQ